MTEIKLICIHVSMIVIEALSTAIVRELLEWLMRLPGRR